MRCHRLERLFPNLVAAGYEKTSEATGKPPTPGTYNCIAWAASDTHHGYWWPDQYSFWPWWIKRERTLACFVRTFRWLGYRLCNNSSHQFLYEKIALYALGQEPKHMARQLRDGTWTSKCGDLEDITHFTLDALESYGPVPVYLDYGRPALFMRRSIPLSWIVRLLQRLEWLLYSSWKWS